MIGLDVAKRIGKHRPWIHAKLSLVFLLWIELQLEVDELLEAKWDPDPVVFNHLEEIFECKWIACRDPELDFGLRTSCLYSWHHLRLPEPERASRLHISIKEVAKGVANVFVGRRHSLLLVVLWILH